MQPLLNASDIHYLTSLITLDVRRYTSDFNCVVNHELGMTSFEEVHITSCSEGNVLLYSLDSDAPDVMGNPGASSLFGVPLQSALNYYTEEDTMVPCLDLQSAFYFDILRPLPPKYHITRVTFCSSSELVIDEEPTTRRQLRGQPDEIDAILGYLIAKEHLEDNIASVSTFRYTWTDLKRIVSECRERSAWLVATKTEPCS